MRGPLKDEKGAFVVYLLSKSKFVAGVQCLKRLYWQMHEPELGAPPDEATETILQQGYEVGQLAHQLFPGGVAVENGSEDLRWALQRTQELVSDPKVPAIFEATFEHDHLLVRVDVLERQSGGRWRLIEVKSAGDLKDHFVYDVGIQRQVVSGCGIELSAVCLMHLNREYVYLGGAYDLQQLFRIRDMDEPTKEIDSDIKSRLSTQFKILEQPQAPEVAPGPQCEKPYRCEFFDCCNPPVGNDHVTRLPRIHARAVEKLASMGVESIRDIPDDFPLTDRQRMACTSVQTGTPHYDAGLKDELEGLRFPLYFMDFETLNPAIPRFAGMRPFDQLPFEWSVHVQRHPGAEPEHHEFLAMSDADPRREFIASLCSVLGDSGSIVVYNQTFESGRLSDLATWVPEFAEPIDRIQKRLWDLLPVIRDHVYHPDFEGSFGLKAVLPALVPELSYDNLEVGDGAQAGIAWESMVHADLSTEARARLRQALLAYCGQDTLALARLMEKLRAGE
jgi:hypothetical protein